jgi:hypothetical protein
MIPNIETFKEILIEADAAGKAAVENMKVIPMLVGQAKGLFSNEIDYSKPVEYVSDGVCGFAWVNILPEYKGNTKLGKEERKVLEACGFEKDWTDTKKFSKWISDYNQSLQKKETYARVFAEVLSVKGIKSYAQSRID